MGRACEYACRLSILGCEHLVVDAIHTERALLHRARRLVELASAIRPGPGAEVAAHALVLVHQHDSVRPLVGSARRAHGDAVGILAVQARHGEVDRLAGRILAYLVMANAIEPD